MNAEEARQGLREYIKEDGDERRRQRIDALPDELKAIGLALFREPGSRTPDEAEKHERARVALHALGEQDRTRIFEAAFPGVGHWVEAGWRLIPRLPYAGGYQLKAFRAPSIPEAVADARDNWLNMLHMALRLHEEDILWFAAWAPYVNHGFAADSLVILFAAAIDSGKAEGDQVFDILMASARGEHEIGGFGAHVVGSFLTASRPEGWEYLERLLVAAQRQEGLRQSILEHAHRGHPEAFRRILALILEHDMIRFSSAIRAVDVWLDFGWEAMDARFAAAAVKSVLTFLTDTTARDAALLGGDAHEAYLAVWTLGFADAGRAIEAARGLLGNPSPETRYAAAYILAELHLYDAAASLLPALADPDLRIAACALSGVSNRLNYNKSIPGAFEAIVDLLPRLPEKPQVLDPLLWPWTAAKVVREEAADLLYRALGDGPAERLIPYVPTMSPSGRGSVARLLGQVIEKTPEMRRVLLDLAGDASSWVRDTALKGLASTAPGPDEAVRLEALLTRKAADLRLALIKLLMRQDDEAALASARRLLAAKSPPQRLAGLEMLREMDADGRQIETCRALGGDYAAASGKRTPEETAILDRLLAERGEEVTLENGLGLFDPKDLSPRVPPSMPKRWAGCDRDELQVITPAAIRCAEALAETVHANRDAEIEVKSWRGVETQVLGSAEWGFPGPDRERPLEEDIVNLPLREVWEAWWRDRPADTCDEDGCELLRVIAALDALPVSYGGITYRSASAPSPTRRILFADDAARDIRYRNIVENVARWLMRLHPPAGAAGFLLDALELSYALALEQSSSPQATDGEEAENDEDDEDEILMGSARGRDWRDTDVFTTWRSLTWYFQQNCPTHWTAEHETRFWRLQNWRQQPSPEWMRKRVEFETVWNARRVGASTDADIYDALLGPRDSDGYEARTFSSLALVTERRPRRPLAEQDQLGPYADRCRERILEIELARGELPTAASLPALSLKSVTGMDAVVRILAALGKDSFTRGYIGSWNDTPSRSDVFSHLVRVSTPAGTDTVEGFKALAAECGIGRQKLIELAMYAPQWARFVEQAVDTPDLAEAVWWMHAHTKDDAWTVNEEIRDLWKAQVSERTPLTAETLIDGAVDVAWFHRLRESLGTEHWSEVDDAAKFASGGGGHKRAQLFADAMLGRTATGDLSARIAKSRHQDSVRALGLVPVAAGDGRAADIQQRYAMLQEFIRGTRQFGAQRQQSEKLAAAIGMENLARTAGYPDPIRLEWAMEARAVADLKEGPVRVTEGGVTVSLAIDEWGAAQVSVTKGGKPLKAVPPAVKKADAVAALLARKTELDKQASRMHASLEAAMCRGDALSGTELRTLMEHPVLVPMLRSLVLIGEELAGYPIDGGRAVESHDGQAHPVAADTALRIAHPADLLATGAWHAWQHECIMRERIQPFKQVFRELYVVTSAEIQDTYASRRYAGHQVNKNQAFALLGKRGWVGNAYSGDMRRTFHDTGLIVSLQFNFGFTTPAEVEGLTIDTVGFVDRKTGGDVEPGRIPPRIFSEAMRDVDLVVSVAHQGGVDPEASMSTVEMRAALVRETCGLLSLSNVHLKDNHAVIDGKLSSYSVHLGSAVVHTIPGGHLCIVPVHGQHRGRLFLPFVDDDPRTAEIVSKVILLAKDDEIKDPVILEQIRAQG
jgi:hypothetical protein